MQLTNIARDVAEDWERRRVYLPRDDMSEALRIWLKEHGDDPTVPALPVELRADLAASTRRLLERAERYYDSADVGMTYLAPRSALAIRSARLIYAEIGRVLEARSCDVLAGRATVPAIRKARLTLTALGRFARDRRRWEHRRLLAPADILDAADAVRLA
jgi:phytoene synthase